jgi:tetratricopeptide (TPR) repeat protein
VRKHSLVVVGSLLLLASFGSLFVCRLATASVVQLRTKATGEQETRMLGMLLGAMEDLYGGNAREARSKYERIVREIEKLDYSPKLCWKAYEGYGRALLEAGDKAGALKALARAVEEAKPLSSKERVDAICKLGFALEATGDLPAAIDQYKTALTIQPRDIAVMLDLGSAYRRAKLFKEAKETCESIIAIDPRNADAHMNLGNAYLDQGEIEKAVIYYNKFAAYSDNKGAAAKNLLNAGFRYYDGKEYAKALTLYERALELAPENPLAYTDIGWTKLALGQKQGAIEAFERALQLNPPEQVKDYARKGLKAARGNK